MRGCIPFSSLRVRLILLVLLAVLPPLGVIIYTALEWDRHEAADGQAHALGLAHHASAIHERLIDESRHMLWSVAQLPPALRSEAPRLTEILLAFLREHPHHNNLGVIRPDGTIISSARPPGDSIDVAGRSFFRRALETRQFAMGDYEIDRAAGTGTVTFAHPVLDQAGRVQQVLFTVMDLACVRELAAEAQLPGGTTVTVFDNTGLIVAHRPDPSRWVGRSALQDPVVRDVLARNGKGTAEGTSLDGIPHLVAFKPLLVPEGAGSLYVSVSIPRAAATAESSRILARNLVGLGSAGALALVVAWIGGDLFLLRGVRALASATKKLSGGDLSARTGLPHEAGELNQLATAFDEMAAALEQREREILRRNGELASEGKRFRALIENSSDAIALLDRDATLLYASPSTTRVLGCATEELLGRDAFELVHPDDRERARARFAEAVQRPRGFVSATFRVRHKDGSWRWIGSVASNLLDDPSVQAVIGNYRDITARKEAEEALIQAHEELELRVQERTAELRRANDTLRTEIADRKRAEAALFESEERFRLLLDSAAEGIYGVDLEGNCTFCNAAALRLLGVSDPRDLLGAPMHAVIHHSRRDGTPYPEAQCPISDAFRKGAHIHADTEVFWRADGTSFPVEYWSHPMRRGGEIIGAVVTFLDITERQWAHEKVLTLSRAIEQTADSVFVTDRDGITEYVNPAFEWLTGFSQKEAIGATPRVLKSGRHDRRFYETLWNTILSGEVFRSVFTNRTKDGRLYYEDETITPIRDSEGRITHFVSTGRDITQRKRTEEALRRLNDRLEHEATRIAGVLHDEAGQFLTSAHITLAEVARDVPQARERLLEVRRDLDRIEEQLRRLSHELRPRILDDLGLVDALKFLADGVARRSGIPISVEAPLEHRCAPMVETALYRLVQEALTNMSKHARATRATIVLKQEDQKIHCSIRDDGLGFNVAAALAQRGDPHLGLIGIQDRLEAIGGVFEIISASGKGTELRATIPVEPPPGPGTDPLPPGPAQTFSHPV